MGSHHPIRKTVAPEPPLIPDKLYFRIGDVARLCAVPAYVLRFWESEFPQLKPNKGGTGQRLYRRKDVEMALRIKSLLYDQGYTIPGARQVFKADGARSEAREAGSLELTAAPPTPLAAMPMAAAAASMPVVARPGAAGPIAAGDLGDQIRERAQMQERLRALRAEMLSLLDMLGGQVAGPEVADKTPGPETPAKPMRPRLVLEPKPAAKPEPRLRLERREEKPERREERLDRREERPDHQRALFLFDPPDAADIAASAAPATPVEMAE